MTREEIIDLLTMARVYDGRVTLGKAETAAWYLAIGRMPLSIAQQAVVAHYTAAVEPGHEYPKIAPGHVVAYYQAHNRPDDKPLPELETPKASPEFAAEMAERTRKLIADAAAKLKPPPDPDGTPRWRPGVDKRELAREQVEASRRRRMESPEGGEAS